MVNGRTDLTLARNVVEIAALDAQPSKRRKSHGLFVFQGRGAPLVAAEDVNSVRVIVDEGEYRHAGPEGVDLVKKRPCREVRVAFALLPRQ